MASAVDSRHDGGVVGGVLRWRYKSRVAVGETGRKSWQSWQRRWKIKKAMLRRCYPAGGSEQWEGKTAFGRDAELILYTVAPLPTTTAR